MLTTKTEVSATKSPSAAFDLAILVLAGGTSRGHMIDVPNTNETGTLAEEKEGADERKRRTERHTCGQSAAPKTTLFRSVLEPPQE